MKSLLQWAHKKVRGVAILMVLVSLAMLMAVVTEFSTKELVRYKLAINERDALQAEALAQSGANFAQLILMVQEPLQSYMTNFAKTGVQLPAYTIWELMPIDSTLLKGITDGSFMPDIFSDQKKETNAQEKKTLISEDKVEEEPLFGPYKTPEGGYGGFRGRFSTAIEDEERKISIRKWAKPQTPFPKRKMIADQLFRILSKKEYEHLFDGSMGDNRNIGPSQLIGNIYDYISPEDRAVDVSAPKEDWGRNLLGDKRSHYFDTPLIGPKRAPIDSLAELRLIPGVTDAIYQILSKIITIYGEGDSINILSASDEVLGSAFYLCAKNKEFGSFQRPNFEVDLLADWNQKKNEGALEISADGVMKFLQEHGVEVDKDVCSKSIGTESKTFTVKSTATVGRVTKTLVLRLRSTSGITTLYQFQYL
jgi:hypothetical protein